MQIKTSILYARLFPRLKGNIMKENALMQGSVEAVNAVVLSVPRFQYVKNNSTDILNPVIYNELPKVTSTEITTSNLSATNKSFQEINLIRKQLVEQYKIEILSIIQNDNFEDGFYSQSEAFIDEQLTHDTITYIKSALNEVYIEFIKNSHVLTGIMLMCGRVSYDDAFPELPTMAIGLLQHKDDEVRDRAIQAFERWNSKKGLDVLESLRCEKAWMQRYVNKVIEYIKREGVD